MYFHSSDGQVLWSLHHLLHLLMLFSIIRRSTIAALPRMLVLWSSYQTVFVETASRWILISAVNFAAVLVRFIDTVLFNVWQSISLSFGFRPLFLLADDVLLWFVYVIITLETAAVDTPNKVAVFVTDAPAKCAPTIWPLWKPDKSPILQHFHTNCY